ncbi:MAG: NINE protein [Elusimicrobia bacterium]|nr:NINE protein [Elusimicrobiota bacterium]
MSEQVFCTYCGASILPEAVVCMKCGCPAVGGKKYCRFCGESVRPEQAVCLKCGHEIRSALSNSPAVSREKRSRVAAVLLALLLGGVGAHKFYLGRPVAGVLYFLFCWTFIPAIIAFIEMLMYLCMSEREFDNKYNCEAER